MGLGFDFFMFSIFPVIWSIMFLLIFGLIIVTIVRGLKQWNKNNHSPRLTVDARVLAKRHDVSRRRSAGEHHHYRTVNTYYVTFEVESGDRMELRVTRVQYDTLYIGAQGRVSFQGTRYLGFESKYEEEEESL